MSLKSQSAAVSQFLNTGTRFSAYLGSYDYYAEQPALHKYRVSGHGPMNIRKSLVVQASSRSNALRAAGILHPKYLFSVVNPA